MEKFKQHHIRIGAIPTRGSSKYFVMINCIHTSAHGVRICFQTIILYGCNVKSTTLTHHDELFLTFYDQTKHVSQMRVCSTSTTVSCVWGNNHAIHKHGLSGLLQPQCLGWNRHGHCNRPLCSDRLTAQLYCDFVITVLLGLLEDVQKLWFQHDACLAVGEHNISRRQIGCWGLTARPPWSPDVIAMEAFLWGHLKEHVYAVHPELLKILQQDLKQL
jgi:hypothetical protein